MNGLYFLCFNKLLYSFGFIIVVLFTVLFFPSLAIAQAAPQPTFVCLGDCPEITANPTNANQAPVPSTANAVSPQASAAPAQAVNNAPTAQPCQPVTAVHSAQERKFKHTKKTVKKTGANSDMSGLLQKLIKLIEQLIALIQQILGGGLPSAQNAVNNQGGTAGGADMLRQAVPGQAANPQVTLPPCPTNTPAANQQAQTQPAANQQANGQQPASQAAQPAQANPNPATQGANMQPAGGANVVHSAQCDGAEPPAGAKAAGLTKLAFCEDFSDPSRIDFDGNPIQGKTTFTMLRDGNIFTVTEEDKSSFEFTGEGTMKGNSKYSNYQADFISTWPTGGGNYQGYAASKNSTGWYVETKVKHNTASLNTGFFAFWSMATCKIYGSNPGCLEPDFYEYIGSKMIHAIHYYPEAGGNANRKSTMCSAASNSDRTQFFTTGVLYGPGNEYIHWYDNDQVTCKKTRGEYPQMAEMAKQDYPIIFGSGPSQPYEIDYVRVWVK